jgi:hypothetical protein
MMRIDEHAFDALGLEIAELAGQQRLARYVHECFGNVEAERTQSGTVPGAEEHRVHRVIIR